jgi:hypothetical protein
VKASGARLISEHSGGPLPDLEARRLWPSLGTRLVWLQMSSHAPRHSYHTLARDKRYIPVHENDALCEEYDARCEKTASAATATATATVTDTATATATVSGNSDLSLAAKRRR